MTLFIYKIWYSHIATRTISICKLEKNGQERERKENNELDVISNQQENEAFVKLPEQGQTTQERNNSSYKENGSIRTTIEQQTRRRTVLVCDDEKDLLLMFAISLQTSYNVLTAKSGEECIKIYLDARRSGRKIDMILLDYRLGDTNGYHVAHKIKELNDVKIIMITAYEVNNDIARELEDNDLVVDIVQKPIAIDSLVAKVEQGI